MEPCWADQATTDANLRYVRELVGDEVDLMLDVAMEFSALAQLLPFIPLLETLNFRWIEAPFPLGNRADHVTLASGLTDATCGRCKYPSTRLRAAPSAALAAGIRPGTRQVGDPGRVSTPSQEWRRWVRK